jgi:hypothetical protein
MGLKRQRCPVLPVPHFLVSNVRHDVAIAGTIAGRLAMAVNDAAQTAWASANAAALLHVTAALQATAGMRRPDPAVIDGLCDRAMTAICKSRSK